MPHPSWSGEASRKIVRRLVVEGDLILQTPAHFGNGDADEQVDMPLLTDSLEQQTPLLTGASITGALRNYLREHEHGFRAKVQQASPAGTSANILLFGGYKGDDYGEQSPLIVEDARGQNAAIELRDGVSLVGASRTSADQKLFTLELWEAGTTFPLRFELSIRQGDDILALKQALATALTGFTNGGITLGARKRRGYGQVSVRRWRCKEYNLTNTLELLDWIAHGASTLQSDGGSAIAQVLGVNELLPDHRQLFSLKGEFSLDGSFLIRSDGSVASDVDASDTTNKPSPDIVHLHSRAVSSDDGQRTDEPILSGTSLAGALRARAFKIARVIAPSAAVARILIDEMFGKMGQRQKPQGSRINVYEHRISGIERTLVQNRVSIDRFTGGARDGFLFREQPLFGNEQSSVFVELHLANPQGYEIGLLLLLLKDLWTGDLPLGGESAVGRGRLCGKNAHLEHQNGQVRAWDLQAGVHNTLHVTGGEPHELEHYVTELHHHLGRSTSRL